MQNALNILFHRSLHASRMILVELQIQYFALVCQMQLKQLFQQAAVQPIDASVPGRGVDHRIANDNAAAKVNQYDSAMRNILKTMTIVVVMFFICISPNQILWLLQNLGVITINFSGWTYYMCMLVQICNVCMNPLIYALKYKDFKRGCTRMLRKMSPQSFTGRMKITTISVVTATTAVR
jgi:7 transmembrane receptor (rhodopsin family)